MEGARQLGSRRASAKLPFTPTRNASSHYLPRPHRGNQVVAKAVETAKELAEVFLEGKNEEDLHGHTGPQQKERLIGEIVHELKRQEKVSTALIRHPN